MNDLVSVIIATYNRSDLLLDAVKSVINQTYKNLEIIVCDDSSTDDTRSVIEKLSAKDGRIKYYRIDHCGRPAIPRNIGIQRSHGEWIAFLDDDDIWEIDKIEVQMRCALSNVVSACCTNAYCRENGVRTNKKYLKNIESKIFREKDIFPINNIICSSMLVRKEILQKCNYFPEGKEYKAIEDYALWLKVFCYTDILYIDRPLMQYLTTNQNSISRISNNDRIKRFLVFKDLRIWKRGKRGNIRLAAEKLYFHYFILRGWFYNLLFRINGRL